jgi:hypothetical protein
MTSDMREPAQLDAEQAQEPDFTRERLDPAPLTGPRAWLVAGAERIGSWLGADAASPNPTPSYTSAERATLNVRRKLARGGIVALAVIVALVLSLGSLPATQTALHGAWNTVWNATHPRPILSAPDYALQNLPSLAVNQPQISLAPAVVASGVAYLCWANIDSNPLIPLAPNQISAYATSDYGQNWRALPIPLTKGQDCTVETDQLGGPDLLLLAAQGNSSNPCQSPLLLVSHDSGATWRSLPLPGEQAGMDLCGMQVTLADGAIYASSQSINQPLLPGLPGQTPGIIAVTRDDGATWRAADTGLGLAAQLTLIGFRHGGRILASIPETHGRPEAARLITSSDYGATWRDLGDIPGAFPTIYASSDPGVVGEGGWGQLYAIARPMVKGEAGPATSFILEAGTVGGHWATIPAPPLLETNANPNNNLPTILGVGPAGSLFVQRGVVSSTDRSQITPALWLWVWSRSQKTWLQDIQPFPSNAFLFGWSWSHGSQTYWLATLKLGVPPTLRLLTRSYTATAVQ